MKTKLSVNINKVALIRNSRGGNLPNLLQFALDCERFGAEGITVHPRPDERHIRYADVLELKNVVTTELNVEGYPSPKFMRLIKDSAPHQCTLVPDPPHVLTSDEGWDIIKNRDFLKDVVEQCHSIGTRTSIFINADPKQVEAAKEIGADRVELYTGGYANQYFDNKVLAIESHKLAGDLAVNLGIGLNAGHDLNLDNLKYYAEEVYGLMEVSIGHAIVSDALYFGIQNTIQMYKGLL